MYTEYMKEVEYEGPPMDEARPESIERSKGSPIAPTIRTFRNDVNEEGSKTTRLGILMAQRARSEAAGRSRIPEEESEHQEHHFGRIIFLLLLILAFGIGVGMYALIGGRTSTPALSEITEEGKTQTKQRNGGTIAIGHSSREQLLTAVLDMFRAATLARGETKLITLTTTDRAGETVAATTSALFSALDMIVQSETGNLVRSLESTLTYGIALDEASGEISGFLELRSRSYAETFAGMLRLEKTMASDLIPLLKPTMKKSNVLLLRGRAWNDERIEGVSARVLSDPDGVSSLAYAFLPDRKTLIIAGGRDVLRLLVTRAQNTSK